MKFSANLSFLFVKEAPNLVDRFQLARNAGFKAVEFGFPYQTDVHALAQAKRAANLQQVLMNSWPGKLDAGEMGISIYPDRRDEFRQKLELSIEYLKALDCPRLHVMAGQMKNNLAPADAEATYVENMRYAAERLEKEGILAVIEPLNPRLWPTYFLSQPRRALEYIRRIGHPNLRLELDLFHAQISQGDLTQCIRDALPHIGHVQAAQVPDRGELDSPGEVDYRYLLRLLDQVGYDGWVGLEYTPRGSTLDSLKWIKEWGYTL